jgi:hypothetical protein
VRRNTVSRSNSAMAIWRIASVIAGITASERYHRFWSIFFPLHVIFTTTIVLLKLG